MQAFITSHSFSFRRGQLRHPDSRSTNFRYNNYPSSVRELPLPAPQLLSEQESGLEEGRRVYMWIYLQCGARSRVVHDRVRGYMYSFHPAGVVHLYPIAPNPAGKQLRLSPRHQSTKLTATAPSCSRSGACPPAVGCPGCEAI